MNRWLFVVISIVGLLLLGCSKGVLSEDKPPETFVEVENERYETILGTYCWGTTCVDTVGPIEMLEDKEPITVKPGATIAFVMDFEPKPNVVHVSQFTESEQVEVAVEDNHFSAPTAKGVYYYSYGVWWMDEEEENLSHGDAFYAFALEVK